MISNELANLKFSDLIDRSWELYKKNWMALLLFAVLYLLITVAQSLLNRVPFLGFFLSLILSSFSLAATQGFFLELVTRERIKIERYFELMTNLPAVLAAFITTLLGSAGLLLLLIPGIVIFISLYFTLFLIYDKKMAIEEAIKGSWQMTKGYRWKIFGYTQILILLNLGGLLLLGVGLLVTIPLAFIFMAKLYVEIDKFRNSKITPLPAEVII